MPAAISCRKNTDVVGVQQAPEEGVEPLPGEWVARVAVAHRRVEQAGADGRRQRLGAFGVAARHVHPCAVVVEAQEGPVVSPAGRDLVVGIAVGVGTAVLAEHEQHVVRPRAHDRALVAEAPSRAGVCEIIQSGLGMVGPRRRPERGRELPRLVRHLQRRAGAGVVHVPGKTSARASGAWCSRRAAAPRPCSTRPPNRHVTPRRGTQPLQTADTGPRDAGRLTIRLRASEPSSRVSTRLVGPERTGYAHRCRCMASYFEAEVLVTGGPRREAEALDVVSHRVPAAVVDRVSLGSAPEPVGLVDELEGWVIDFIHGEGLGIGAYPGDDGLRHQGLGDRTRGGARGSTPASEVEGGVPKRPQPAAEAVRERVVKLSQIPRKARAWSSRRLPDADLDESQRGVRPPEGRFAQLEVPKPGAIHLHADSKPGRAAREGEGARDGFVEWANRRIPSPVPRTD